MIIVATVGAVLIYRNEVRNRKPRFLAISQVQELAVAPIAEPVEAEHSPPGPTGPAEEEQVAAASTTLRVVTYNIRHGRRDEGRIDLEGVAEALSVGEADLIALQEVDVFQIRSGLADQPDWLARRLGMEHVYGPAMRRGLGEYGNVLLSRHPIIYTRLVKLPAWLEPRGAVIARVRTPNGDLTVAVTHLGLSRMDRKAQVRTLLEALAEEPGPYLLLGDWNAEIGTPELSPLGERYREAFAAAGVEKSHTLRTREGEPVAAIDHIFVSADLKVKEASTLTHLVSDHQPVVITIALPGRAH